MRFVHLLVYFTRVNFCLFSLRLGIRGWLRLVIVAPSGPFLLRVLYIKPLYSRSAFH